MYICYNITKPITYLYPFWLKPFWFGKPLTCSTAAAPRAPLGPHNG